MLASTYGQTHFRIRRTDDQALNAAFDGGDPAEDTNATIGTGVPFRIRFKAEETNGGDTDAGFKIQVKRNAGAYVEAVAYTDTGNISPSVTILSSQYANNAATDTELLSNDAGGGYVNGFGMEADNETNSIEMANQETEVEWCLMIHSFHDGFIQNVAGDTLTFRLVEDDDTVFTGGYVSPVITVAETTGFIGGVFPETPSHIGPFKDTNGNLYLIIEGGHISATVYALIIKSTDGGDTWREMDGGNRPATYDLEAVDIQQVGDTLHILIQKDSDDIWYSTFLMSDHGANPDEWDVSAEVPDAGNANGTTQCAGISVLSDGVIWGFWKQNDGANEQIVYKKRTALGVWDVAETELDGAADDFSGFAVVRGAQQNGAGSELTHIFYQDYTNFEVYHRSLASDATLSARQSAYSDPEQGDGGEVPFTPAIYWDDGGDEVAMVCVLDESDTLLYSVVVTNDGDPEAAKAASDNSVDVHLLGSEQPVGSLAIDSATDTAYLHYSDSATNDLYRDSAINDGGWGGDVEESDARTIYGIRSNVYTHSGGNGGAKVVGYIYVEPITDNDPTYSGFTWYGEYEIPAAEGRATYNTDSHPLGVQTGMGWRFGNP